MSYQVINSKVIIDALPETMRFRGAWQAGSYLPNEVVTYQSQTFIALVETSSATDSADWAQLADKPDAHDLVGVVEVANGGTGSSTPAAARVMLGLEIGVDVQAYNADAATKTFVTSITNPLASRVSTAESDIVDIESAATALTGRVTSAESAASTLTSRVSSAESAATALTGRVTSAENAATTLTGRVSSAETAATILSGRVDIAESDIAAIETAATTLTGRVSTAEGDINAIETAATTLAGRVTDAEAELVSQDGRLDSLEGTSSALGSMAQQNSSNVSITGGSVSVTSLESTGTLSVGGVASLNGGVNITTGLQVDTLTVTNSVDMDGHAINNLATPALVADAANKGYVDQKIADLIGTAPDILDTFQELAAALQNDENAATALAGQVGGLDTRLTQAEADIDSVEGRATALEETDLLYSQRLQSLELNTGDLGTSLTNLANRVSDTESADSALEGRATSLETRATDLEGRVTQTESGVSWLDNERGILDGRVGTVENRVGDVENRATVLEGRATSSEGYIQSLGSGISTLGGLIDSLSGEVHDPNRMASQGTGSVAIVGGTINGTIIGDTAPASAWISNLNVSGTHDVAGYAQFNNDVLVNQNLTVQAGLNANTSIYSPLAQFGKAYAQVYKTQSTFVTNSGPVDADKGITLVDASNYGDLVLTLPVAGSYTFVSLTIKKVDTTDNMVEVVVDGGGLIDGESSKFIPYPQQSVTFYSDGTNWYCI
jgi:predicted  nucleic acid-binding Zn-ribbon protein